ncbi:MAG: PTS sugar transporter subunit IIA [Micrococcaceae bacterium]
MSERKLVGVTSCPDGIGHAYLAAEKLKLAAKDLNYDLQVEVQGDTATDHELTVEDISKSPVVAIVADKKINTDRFIDKKILDVGIAESIENPKKIIEQAINLSKADIFTLDNKDSVWRRLKAQTISPIMMIVVIAMLAVLIFGVVSAGFDFLNEGSDIVIGVTLAGLTAVGFLAYRRDFFRRKPKTEESGITPENIDAAVDLSPAQITLGENVDPTEEPTRNLLDFLSAETIELELNATTREAAIPELLELVGRSGKVTDKEAMLKAAWTFEKQMSTGIGDGVAIPQSKSTGISQTVVAFAKSKDGIKWDEFHKERVRLLFIIAVPKSLPSTQNLEILAALSRKLIDDDFRYQLFLAKTKEETLEMLYTV